MSVCVDGRIQKPVKASMESLTAISHAMTDLMPCVIHCLCDDTFPCKEEENI
jgi:hypothetical protein